MIPLRTQTLIMADTLLDLIRVPVPAQVHIPALAPVHILVPALAPARILDPAPVHIPALVLALDLIPARAPVLILDQTRIRIPDPTPGMARGIRIRGTPIRGITIRGQVRIPGAAPARILMERRQSRSRRIPIKTPTATS